MHRRRVDLHIGVEKTGTSTIQQALAGSREQLLGAGILYPVTPGRVNHVGLAVVGRDDDVVDDIRRRRGLLTPDAVRADRAHMAAELAAEVDAAGVDRVVLSSEHCSSRLLTEGEVERLVGWLDEVVGADVHVHVYLRRQDRMLESRHSTAVRAGASEHLELPGEEALDGVFDFERLLDRWAAVVGDARVHPRRFERARFVGGDLLVDFAAALDLPALSPPQVEKANAALDAPTQRFVALLNREIPRFEDGAPNPLHRDVIAAIDTVEPSGPPARLSDEQAATLLGRVEASNHAVARRWFDGPPLFEPRGTTGGDVAAELDLERAVELAAHVLRHQAAVHEHRLQRAPEPELVQAMRRELAALRERVAEHERVARVAGDGPAGGDGVLARLRTFVRRVVRRLRG